MVTESFLEESQRGGGICSGDNLGRSWGLVQIGQQQIVKQILKQCREQIHERQAQQSYKQEFRYHVLFLLAA